MSKARELADLGSVTTRLDEVGNTDGALSNRNLIINGAMQVAQRGTSATGVTGSGYYSADRWSFACSGSGTFTITQESDAPEGFSKSYKLDCTTADASNTAGELLYLRQLLEGHDVQRLGYGTSSAQSVTVSFWVKSNQTNTFVLTLENSDASKLQSRTYSISSADTWEYKTLTFTGDTFSGFTDDNGTSLQVQFWLSSGTTFTSGTLNSTWGSTVSADYAAGLTANIGDSTSDYFQITGVQLEAGDTATPFEHRSYGDELARCQRYFYKYPDTGDYSHPLDHSSGFRSQFAAFPVIMRANPTLSNVSGSGNYSPANPDLSGGVVHGAYFQWNSVASSSFNRVDSGFTADAEL